MIEAKLASGMSRRLAAKAAKLARAHAENAVHEARSDTTRWRKARLLWPLFLEQG